ncbi:AMP-binding protein [Noviherbaspirillum sp.]|uniref:AMP-binding protein n=1 Tax=Noviherbaspirillum sp. TaxID=1926288 RepID=UPI002FE2CE12
MTHPSHHARQQPEKPAAVFVPGGTALTYGALEALANQAARLLQSRGVKAGGAVVFCVDNCPAFLPIAWACQRIGVRFTPASTRLGAEDIRYITRDSGATALIVSVNTECARNISPLDLDGVELFSLHGELPGAIRWESALARFDGAAIDDPQPGREMMYSSGTTGRPKGVRKPMPDGRFDDPDPRNAGWESRPGAGPDMVHLCTSPLYHAAPYRNVAATLAGGGTCVILEKFDAALALQSIGEFGVTHSVWVPTMFHRLLRLPSDVRNATDLSTHRAAYHGAAPCPIHVKEQMIAWWGPILYEYYAGTEGIGACAITSDEWLAHKGSVGRAIDGIIHILDEHDNELPPGATGLVFFESASTFEYWNDDAKTRRSRSRQGWWTYGDIGHVDADGYLYLTDRRDFVIISGGVNVYPQEIEDFLLRDRRVLDAAVFGVPDEEFGEAIQAIVQVADADALNGDALGTALRAACRQSLGPIKTPKNIRLVSEFPRLPTGKIQKKALRDAFLASAVAGNAPHV